MRNWKVTTNNPNNNLMSKSNGVGTDRRVQEGNPLIAQNPFNAWPPPLPTVPGVTPSYLQPPIGLQLSDLEREVVRIALNEYRFGLSFRLNNAPGGHMPPELMALKFFDTIAATLMERLKGGFTLVDESDSFLPAAPVPERPTASDMEAQPVTVNETSTVTAE